MASFKDYSYDQGRFIPVFFEKQVVGWAMPTAR